MGDWGPGYASNTASAVNPSTAYRCEECGMRQAGGTYGSPECMLCGGSLVRVGGGTAASTAASARVGGGTSAAGTSGDAAGIAGVRDPAVQARLEQVQEQAVQILSAILPPDLLDGAGGEGGGRPTDENVLDELPQIKIEPYVVLRVTPGAGGGGSGDDNTMPRRELLAKAAERRARGGSDSEGVGVGEVTAIPSDAPGDHTAVPPDKKDAGDVVSTEVKPEEAAAQELVIRATASSFGTPLADLPEGVAAPIALAEPRDGASDFVNAAELRGKIALMWRGGCSFVDKVRRAQAAGCTAAIVVQTAGQKWPFTMSDTAGKGTDLLLPSLMIASEDAEALLRARSEWDRSNGDGGGGGGGGSTGEAIDIADAASATSPPIAGAAALWGHARAHDSHTACAVCLQEFQAEELATRLPCMHLFHEDCVRTWLKKNHTCPTCRKALPQREENRRSEASAEGPVSSWDDFAVPRGNAPMSAGGSAMYT